MKAKDVPFQLIYTPFIIGSEVDVSCVLTPTAAPGHPIALSSLIEIIPESLKYSYRKSKVGAIHK